MGVHFSCPFTAYCDLENTIESASVKSNGFGDEEAKNPVRSISYKIRHSEPTMMQPKASRKTTETITRVSVEAPLSKENDMLTTSSDGVEGKERDYEIRRSDRQLPILDLSNEAAIKLQKVYKSFRTRRKLADGAVLIEQSWWKLLDFAELKRSSISFFEIEKHETAISRWSRARTRAAKVGKGLSKNSKAQKLALQHWLEAIDPRHRYGHNLHFYYIKWLHSQSKEPFFYWLDIGEGKEVNLVEKCPRLELHRQCIKYLGPMERKAYEVIVEDGKLLYKQSRLLVDTNGEPNGAKWIFVLSTSMNLYVGQKKKGSFQHSSFLAGGATSAAGRIVVENGNLKAVWPHSGHYRPTPENFQDFITFLKGNNMDLTNVKMDSVDEEEGEYLRTQNSVVLRSISSEEDLSEKTNSETDQMDGQDNSLEKTNSTEEEEEEEEEEEDHASKQSPQLMPPGSLRGKLPNLLIPDRDDLFEELKFENQPVESSTGILGAKSSPLDGYETAEDRMISEHYFSDEEDGETKESIPEEWILKRIDSHKRMNSFQLGKQLSCKWTTGAGPRIGCLRDYPSKLQCHALEQVNLSPRIAGCFRSKSTRESIPNSYLGEIHIRKTSYSGELPRIRYLTPQSSPLLKGASTTIASAK